MRLSVVVALSALAVAPSSLRAQQLPPVEYVQSALSRHRIVFLGDIHPLAEPKRLVSRLIREQPPGGSIDLLALEVASDQQEAIDRYLASVPEDTTILLDHPRTLRAHWGVSAEYLDIYRAVHQWNAAHPERPVHILAADIRGWPMAPLTEHMATGGFVNRDIWMAAAFRKTLDAHPDWRVLAFMGGYHGLKGVGGEVTLGRAHDRFDRWFAGYLTDDGYEVFSILTDALQEGGHGATRMYDHLAAGRTGNFAVELDTTTDVVREPLWDVEQEGYRLEFWPSRIPLRMAVEAMIIFTQTTPITVLRVEGGGR
ncbi:MAG TPA: hypothetical protein VMY76_16430 [Gemmatimonadales bacterium]|nr:hypothetical protein [Gemmatimonadales bacterium]